MADSSLVPVDVDKLMTCLQKIETLEKTQEPRRDWRRAHPKKATPQRGRRQRETKTSKVRKKGGRSEKLCELCAKFSGASLTHWTKDCQKWEKDGTKKNNFKSKKGTSGFGGKPAKQNWKKILQLSKTLGDLEKKVNRRKRKRAPEESD